MTTALARGAERAFPQQAQIPREISAIGDGAARCLIMELETWPKPGLVSDIDSGSHDDMDAGTFRRSAAAIKSYFQDLADAAAQGCAILLLKVSARRVISCPMADSPPRRCATTARQEPATAQTAATATRVRRQETISLSLSK